MGDQESTSLSSLALLADTIKANTVILDDHIARHNHPNPSLGVDGACFSVSSSEKEVLAARATLLSATRELRNLILGPIGILMNIGVRCWIVFSLSQILTLPE